jgi:hypothetical protein
LVPVGDRYYSVFPLGGVLCFLPAALLQMFRGSDEFPARAFAACVGAFIALFAWGLSGRHGDRPTRRALLTALLMFGTWLWCNTCNGGAWQLALSLAVLGQMGALYFVLVRREPLLAGLFFAIGFGNRTEVVLTGPALCYLLLRPAFTDLADLGKRLRTEREAVARFCLVPFALGLATLWYNALRFGSALDFGYSRIPGVLEEPWYRFGIFSPYYLPDGLRAMLLASSWNTSSEFPFFRPDTGGGSIFSACPALLLLFGTNSREPHLRRVAWAAMLPMALVHLMHGYVGCTQYSYRFAMTLLPWLFLLWLDIPAPGGRRAATCFEAGLMALSIGMNAWAAYVLFHLGMWW